MTEPSTRILSRESHAVHSDAAGIKAMPVRLKPSLSAEDGFRVTVLECLAQVSANLPAIRAREMEGVHQMRIGLRRLHVALQAFGDEFQTPETKKLRDRTKKLTDTFADARDLDVFVTDLLKPVFAATGDEEAFSVLADRAEIARRLAWDEAVAAAEKPELSEFLDDVAGLAQGKLWRKSEDDDAKRGRTELSLLDAGNRALDEYLIKARKRGGKIKSCDEHDFHKLRIALKKLRYAAEFFRPLYRKKRVKRYLKEVKAALDLLGSLHDVTAARATLKKLSETAGSPRSANAEIAYATGLVTGWHGGRAVRMSEKAIDCWKRLSRMQPFWH